MNYCGYNRHLAEFVAFCYADQVALFDPLLFVPWIHFANFSLLSSSSSVRKLPAKSQIQSCDDRHVH